MNYIKKIYSQLISQRWELGFVQYGLDGVFSDHPEYLWVKNPFQDRWFADPFILDITDQYIYLLVEEFPYATPKGRITKLTIDKSTMTIVDKKIVLEEPTHLSFPAILRTDGHIYVYPENGKSGVLKLYELIDNQLEFVRDIYVAPLADAVITDLFGSMQMFATVCPNHNGHILHHYIQDDDKLVEVKPIECEDFHARMAGQFFKYNGQIYRPAQDCNQTYGGAIIIEKCIQEGNDIHLLPERRIISAHPSLRTGIHTMNSYKGWTVIDVRGYEHPLLGTIMYNLVKGLKRIFK